MQLDYFLGDYDYNRLRQSGPKLSTKKKHEYIQTKLYSTIYLFNGIECSLQYVLDCHLQAKRNIVEGLKDGKNVEIKVWVEWDFVGLMSLDEPSFNLFAPFALYLLTSQSHSSSL